MSWMKPINVTALFVEDHGRIISLFNDFKDNRHKKTKKSSKIFNELKRTVERHFREEELLYSKYKYRTGNILAVLQTIKREHIILSQRFDDVHKSLNKSDGAVDVSEIYSFLERHKNIEERLLYPELDNVLSDKEKEYVYWKIKNS